MKAEIIYQAGKSYWFGRTRFKQGVRKVVTDQETIDHCQSTTGFSVTIIPDVKTNERPVKKTFREVKEDITSVKSEPPKIVPKKKIKRDPTSH